MDSPGEILRLCRLCLVKDQVNIPIFDEQGDTRQIFLKISSCLPVKVSREDRLPKKICDGCSEKLNSFYEFWSSSANAEKTLLSWVGQEEEEEKKEPTIPKPIAALVKEESEVGEETHVESIEESTKDEAEAPPAKRARRSAAVKAQINITPESEDDDLDNAEPMTKLEDESAESDSEDKDPSYTDIPGTSADDEQAGPSGVGKDGVEAPDKLRPATTVVRKSPRKTKRKFSEYLNVILKESDDDDDDYLYETRQKLSPKSSKSLKVKGSRARSCTFAKNAIQHSIRDSPCKAINGRKNAADIKTSSAVRDLDKMFICKRCPQQFSTLKELKLHRKEHIRKEFIESHTYYFDESQELYICSTCSAEFKDDKEAERHTKSHGEVLQCPQCPEKFQTIFQLGSHLKVTHSKDDQFTCPLCPDLRFAKPSLFTKHIDTKHQKRYMYNCKECGKGFHSQTLCREHMNVHLGVKPFNCVVCGALFTYSKSVVTHQLKAHRVEILGKSHTTECSFCRNRFVSVASLERHVNQVHSTPKPPKEKIHLCDVCGMGFAKKNKMVVHQRVHTGVKPYPCRYCERSFSKSGERNCHERIHTGERPYSCEYCGKAFRQSAPFKVHIRTHTGERPYVCDLCSKGFTTNQGLKLHKKNCSVLDYRI